MKRTTAIVVGYGSIGRRHTANLLSDARIEHVTVCTSLKDCPDAPDPSRVSIVSGLDDAKGDFAIVANNTSLHAETTRLLLSRGIGVLVEKPLAVTKEDAQNLVSEAMEAKVPCGVAYNMRFLRILRHIRDLLSRGAIGRPVSARIEVGQHLAQWRSGRDYRESYSSSVTLGGGAALDLSHEVDYMRMLFGEPTAHTVMNSRTGVLDSDIEDAFDGLYRFDDGLVCSVHTDLIELVPRRRLSVTTDIGRLDCDLLARSVEVSGDMPDIAYEQSDFDMARTYVDEVGSFISAVTGTRTWDGATLEDGLRTLRLLEAT